MPFPPLSDFQNHQLINNVFQTPSRQQGSRRSIDLAVAGIQKLQQALHLGLFPELG